MTDNVEDFLTDDQRAAFAKLTVRRPHSSDWGEHMHAVGLDQLPIDCPDCGFQIGSFACKIRHLQINTGAAKAAED